MAFIPIYLLVLGVTITVDYFVGIVLERMSDNRRKLFLILSIVTNIGILFIFKYFNFFNSNIESVANFFHWNYSYEGLKLILPIGLSFHTFQSLSYIIEVYKGNQKAEHNYGIFALYVMFYPQLVAGPIERPQHMLHQFHERHEFNFDNFLDGLKIMLWGMFKKVVIADRLAIFVNAVYNNPESHTGSSFVIATIFFAFQIYCDFSGYSDIARGAAKTMGFELMVNFDKPYLSKSVDEFWKRWHISLSSWFKDYVYIPLGGNRVSESRLYFNLLITFTLSGFWHGANWTYLFWGGLNGLYLIVALQTKRFKLKISKVFRMEKYSSVVDLISIASTFVLICFSWIFFRAKDIHDALYIIKSIFLSAVNMNFIESLIKAANSISNFGTVNLLLSFILIVFLIGIEMIQSKIVVREYIDSLSYFSWAVYYFAIISIIVLGIFSETQFIYFQF